MSNIWLRYLACSRLEAKKLLAPSKHCNVLVFLLLSRITLSRFEEKNFNLMIEIMRKGAIQAQPKQSTRGRRAAPKPAGKVFAVIRYRLVSIPPALVYL